MTSRIVSLAERTARWELRRICRATSSVSASSRPWGTTFITKLHCRARSGSIGSAVRTSCIATPVPQVLTSRVIPPSPWWNPRRASKDPNMARSEATRRSQASASSRPAASAQPLMAAITGLGIRCIPRVRPTDPEVDDLPDPGRSGVYVIDRDVRAQIGARAERVALPRQDRDVDRVVIAEVRPDPAQLLVHRRVDRVLGLGPAQGHERDAVSLLVPDGLDHGSLR